MPATDNKTEEISLLSAVTRNETKKTIRTVVITAVTGSLISVLLTGAKFSDDLKQLNDNYKLQHAIDSVEYAKEKERNDKLINALETSNQAIINLDSTVDHQGQQLEFMEEKIDYIIKRVDDDNRK